MCIWGLSWLPGHRRVWVECGHGYSVWKNSDFMVLTNVGTADQCKAMDREYRYKFPQTWVSKNVSPGVSKNEYCIWPHGCNSNCLQSFLWAKQNTWAGILSPWLGRNIWFMVHSQNILSYWIICFYLFSHPDNSFLFLLFTVLLPSPCPHNPLFLLKTLFLISA